MKKPTLSLPVAGKILRNRLSTGDNSDKFQLEAYQGRQALLLYVYPSYPKTTLRDAIKALREVLDQPAWERLEARISVCIEGLVKSRFLRIMEAVDAEGNPCPEAMKPWKWQHDGQCIYLAPRRERMGIKHCTMLNHGKDMKLARAADSFGICVEIQAPTK